MLKKIKKYLILLLLLLAMIGVSYIENVGVQLEITEFAKVLKH